MKRISLLAAIGFFLLLQTTARAQSIAAPHTPGNGVITGKVLPARGEKTLPEGLMVTVTSFRGIRETQPVHTSGTFTFPNLVPGEYTVTLRAPGRARVERNVELGAGIGTGFSVYVALNVGQPLENAKDRVPPRGSQTEPVVLLKASRKVRSEFKKAQIESQRKHPEKAIRHFRKALKGEPKLYPAYLGMAVEWLRLGKKVEAIDAFEHALSIHPQDAVANRNLGALYLDRKKPDRAVPVLERSVQLDAQVPTLMLLGQAYFTLRKFENAAGFFKRACDSSPENSEAHLDLAHSLVHLARYAEAVKHYRIFLAEVPTGDKADRAKLILAQIEPLVSGQ